ncbi:MAG: ComF family protein [Myxococcales bacterium FL481]|nr:MAG: ComF family protein [Myxococcales bacterium FL481]
MTAITALKFSRDLAVAGPLGGLLADADSFAHHEWDAIVPVPLGRSRLIQRGFNQAEVLAERARQARKLGGHRVAALRRLLRRRRATVAQHELPLAARQANVAGAFCPRGSVRGLRLLVIDDVTTTGATLIACLAALRRAGARQVAGLALLRTLA